MKSFIFHLIITLVIQLSFSKDCKADVTPLSRAIDEFNEKSKLDHIGVNQPPLTLKEVLAAILLWESNPNSPVSEKLSSQFKRIADSKIFPGNATFESINGFDRGGNYIFDVWSVRIVLEREDASSYAFVIRDRVIGLRTLQEELDRLTKFINDENVESWVGGYRYLDRKKELEARINKIAQSTDHNN